MKPTQRPDPADPVAMAAADLRRELAAVILALLRANTLTECERLTTQRNELGKRLAHLLTARE